MTPCRICADTSRDPTLVCVVERPNDLHSIDLSGNTAVFITSSTVRSLRSMGSVPMNFRIRELIQRLQRDDPTSPNAIREVVLATNPSVEGEATALYLSRLLKPLGLKFLNSRTVFRWVDNSSTRTAKPSEKPWKNRRK